jgi:hypothetical protein
MAKSSAVARYVIGADLHFPKVSWPTFNAMLHLIDDIKPAGFVFQGDQFDNEEISHHNSNKPYYKEKRSYLRNQEQFIERILNPLDKVLGAASRTWIIGNHDDWEFQFVERHPEFDGFVDRVAALSLKSRGWEIVPLGHAKRIGELNIIHGEVLTGIGNQAGMYPSRKAVELYGGNVLAAHTHAPQSFTKISPVQHKRKHMGWISPILGATNPAYLKNRPTAWLTGFSVLEVYNAKGYFNLYPVIVADGECSYAGKRYGK